MRRVYLDCNATAPLRDEARAVLRAHLDDPPGNASSAHAFGQQARTTIESARASLAGLVGADPRTLCFTSGGSEANNLALYGMARTAPAGRRRIVASSFEHPSVLAVLEDLAGQGFEVVYVAPQAGGVVPAAALLDAAVASDTALVTLMLANNEVGTLQPVSEVASALRSRGIPIHCDAAQAIGRIPVQVEDLGVDLMTCAAHKMGGPQGIGALYVREGVALPPHLRGGGQEQGRRPGTESVGLIAAYGAVAAAVAPILREEAAHIAALREYLEHGALERVPGAHVNGAGSPRLPNTSNLYFPGLQAESLVAALDLEGVAVSAGPACSSGTQRRSSSLVAMGLVAEASGSIRVSLGPRTTRDDVDLFLRAIGPVVERVAAHRVARVGTLL